MKKISSLIISLLLFLITITSVYSISNNSTSELNKSNLNFLYFYNNYNLNTTKIAFEVKFDGNLKKTDYFELNTYYSGNISTENKLIKASCFQVLENIENVKYRKITCEIPKVIPGKFIYTGNIVRNNGANKNIISSLSIVKYYYPNFNANLSFKNLENNKTEVIININKNISNLKIISKIPKSVINSLTEKNKNSLIKSNIPYEIINSDPLIAWNVEKAPATIKYTINKKISAEDRKRFNIQVSQNNNKFNYFKYIIIFLTIIILLSILKPIFLKKKK